MDINLRTLARGFLQSSRITLYSPAAGVRGFVNSLHFYNKSSSSQYVSVWLVSNSSRIALCPEDYVFGSKYTMELADVQLGLEPGDYIEAKAGVNTQIAYFIGGFEDIL